MREAHYRSPQSEPAGPASGVALSPRDLYLQEKARRAGRPASTGQDLIEEARQEFRALLAAEAVAGKGGRPRKNPPVVARPRTAIAGLDVDLDDDLPDAREEGVPKDGGGDDPDE